MEELEVALTNEAFNEWRLFDYIEPIGDVRADVLHGMLSATIAASAGRRSAPGDFIPNWGKWLEDQSAESEVESIRVTSGMIAMAREAGITIENG